jgi:hypothetical protein
VTHRRYGSGFGLFGVFFAVIVLLIVVAIGVEIYAHTQTKTVTFRVQDKERVNKCDSDGKCDSYYLIFTNKGTYKNADSLWFFKFRSSDLYGNLQRGHTYTCKTYGFRIGLTSSYPNIISCEGV